jgi:hypothetical protein
MPLSFAYCHHNDLSGCCIPTTSPAQVGRAVLAAGNIHDGVFTVHPSACLLIARFFGSILALFQGLLSRPDAFFDQAICEFAGQFPRL